MKAGVIHPPGATARVAVPTWLCGLCTIAGLLGMAHAGTVLGQAPLPEQRFAVTATLDAEPGSLSDSRFSLRGTLEPQRSANIAESVGIVLKADLFTKGGDTCVSPQLVFSDGFEGNSP